MKPIISSAVPTKGLRAPRTLGQAFGHGSSYYGLERDHNRADRLIGRVCLLILALGVITMIVERFA